MAEKVKVRIQFQYFYGYNVDDGSPERADADFDFNFQVPSVRVRVRRSGFCWPLCRHWLPEVLRGAELRPKIPFALFNFIFFGQLQLISLNIYIYIYIFIFFFQQPDEHSGGAEAPVLHLKQNN